RADRRAASCHPTGLARFGRAPVERYRYARFGLRMREIRRRRTCDTCLSAQTRVTRPGPVSTIAHMPTSVAITLCVFLAVIAAPLALRLVAPNRLYGFRTPATLSNPELWYSA